ncbi:MAG: gliding motility-associated C-terminal domain-containing protein [Chitinophagaceae bacterium]|nr:MAG: gliding motility-associated C-terminal domain-containing protein [Chitinophagaceae bacterium]
MKPITLLLLCLFFLPEKARTQNLVPNSGFENMNGCPYNLVSIPYTANYSSFPTVTDWTNPLRLSSPDYFNTCASGSSGLKIPNSQFGYQLPFNGNAYAGIILWEAQLVNGQTVFDYREYLQTRLQAPLTAGKQYCVSFRVSPTVSPGFDYNYVWMDEIGVNLSSQRTIDTQHFNLSLPYSIRNVQGQYITDSSGWIQVKGSFTAGGGEQWLTLGSFKNAAPPSFINAFPATPNPTWNYRAYVFIEDVQVREISSSDTIVTYHDTVVCSIGNQLQLSVPSGADQYIWHNGSGSAAAMVQDTGLYWCHSVYPCGLQVDSFRIRFKKSVKLNLGSDSVNCNNQQILLSAGNNFNSYLWNTGSTDSILVAPQSGDYFVMVADSCGLQTDTIRITIQPPVPVPIVNDTIICQGILRPDITVSGDSLRWYLPNSSVASPVQPVIVTSSPGIQTLFVSQISGLCESPAVPVNIRVLYKPDADIGNFYSICSGADSLIGQSYPDVTYLWQTNEMVCCIIPREQGTYYLTISNQCGSSTDTAFVEISDCDECLWLPNAFSPNGDGRNDQLTVLSKCPAEKVEFRIFNRWGQLVFDTHNPATGWDGSFKGKPALPGVYVYQISYRSVATGRRKELKGNVSLLR